MLSRDIVAHFSRRARRASSEPSIHRLASASVAYTPEAPVSSCAAGHVAVAAQLLSAGASSTARDAEGLTPAELAHRALHLDVVRVFVDHSRQELRAAKKK